MSFSPQQYRCTIPEGKGLAWKESTSLVLPLGSWAPDVTRTEQEGNALYKFPLHRYNVIEALSEEGILILPWEPCPWSMEKFPPPLNVIDYVLWHKSQLHIVQLSGCYYTTTSDSSSKPNWSTLASLPCGMKWLTYVQKWASHWFFWLALTVNGSFSFLWNKSKG